MGFKPPRPASPHGGLRALFINTRDDLGADVAMHLQLARYLGAEGVNVTFTVNRQATDAAKMTAALRAAPDVQVVSLPLGRPMDRRTPCTRATTVASNLAVLWSFVRLAELVRRQRVDVLHATDRPRDALLCTLLGRVTGRPTIIHMHSNYYPSINRLTRWAFAHCSCVLGISDFTTRSMAEAGVPADRQATVLNAVDVDRFDPHCLPRGTARERWHIPAGAPLIGLIGRLIPYKGHEDLLDALAADGALSRVHLLIVGKESSGTPEYAESLRARVAALGLEGRVHFTGFQDVGPIYADLDVLVVPSWDEPFGLVVAEAMAMRVPVLAYRAGGVPEIVRSGVEGLLVAPRATAELAASLVQLVNDSELRVRLGAAGRLRVLDRFTPARQASEVSALYQRLSAKKGHARNVAAVSD